MLSFFFFWFVCGLVFTLKSRWLITALCVSTVLGVEFCTSYVDLHGRRVGGFYCDQEIKPYCCTQLPQRKFCCSGVERLKLNAEQNSVLFERTFR